MAYSPRLLGQPSPPSQIGEKLAKTWDILKPYVTGPADAWVGLMNADPYTLLSDTGPAAQKAVENSFNVAGTMAGGSSVVPKPANALNMAISLGSFPGKKAPSIDALVRATAKGKFAFHSGVAADVPTMSTGGVEPQVGPWVREVLSGTVDDVESVIDNSTPVAWWSKQPNWVHMKVAREIGKTVRDVTESDIANYGHLAMVPKKNPDAEGLYWIGENGLNNGPYSMVEDVKGNNVKAYDTPLFDNGDPVGVEKNEYVTTDSIEPYLQLTGTDLVEFLRKSGYLNKYGMSK